MELRVRTEPESELKLELLGWSSESEQSYKKVTERSLSRKFKSGGTSNLNILHRGSVYNRPPKISSFADCLKVVRKLKNNSMAGRAVVKFTSQLKEIRIHLCQSSQQSQGLRDFVNKYYTELKSQNPALPILIRECSGVEPKIWTRFEFGREKSAAVSGLPAEDILKAFTKLTK